MYKKSVQLKLIEQWIKDNKIVSANLASGKFSPASNTDALAIIGLAGYFPSCMDVTEFWQCLDADKSMITEIPQQRKNWYQHAMIAQPDNQDWSVPWGGFIPDIASFDPEQFGILPMEAEEMDPRQRLLLMATYHCFEDANISLRSLKKSNTGVFIGCESNEYVTLMARHGYKPNYSLNQADSMIANRISYQFDLAGPSELINATCAGFAVALHRATLALRMGFIDRALVGAANIILLPDITNQLHDAKQLTQEQTVKSFGEQGTGFIRSEGVGVILLERLQDAESAEHQIYVVIKNTSVNFNGQGGVSMTSPNIDSHCALIKDCYRKARIDPRQVSYVEAQGMGLPVADIAEWTAINRAFSQLCNEQDIKFEPGYCRVSTLKPMLGHMHSASSLGAMLKIIRSLQTEKIYKILDFQQANKYCDMQGTPCRIATKTEVWPVCNSPRLGAIHSYGSGGNNAHILMEEYQGANLVHAEHKRASNYDFAKQYYWFQNLSSSTPVFSKNNNTCQNFKEYPKVLASISQLLGLNQLTEVTSKKPFTDLGLDSVSVEPFIKRLEAEYPVKLRRSDLFSYPTPDAFSHKIAGLMQDTVQKIDAVNNKESASKPLFKIEDIAIIGIDIKVAGANNYNEFWQLLRDGKSGIRPIPESRRLQYTAQMKTTLGGFMAHVDKFDPLFFNISPRESHNMDPHHRLLLQSAWSAIEDAGYDPNEWRGGKHGIFVGMEESDYPITENSTITSVHAGTAPARIGYFLDIKGPLLTLSTACSSSQVAVHYACQSIINCDSELALASSCNIICQPERVLTALSRMGDMLSPDGTCYAFDSRANGMVIGEGCATIMLKRYSEAFRDGDSIYAVIKGSSINYDGQTNGLTAPSGARQSELYTQVYQKSGVTPEQIGYVISHGTGTVLGDPVECNALIDAFNRFNVHKKQYCALTSPKTNIGHTQAASGIINLIAGALALKNQAIPPSLNYVHANDDIDFSNSPFYVNVELKTWNEAQRFVAVSSFGHTGTNAHIVLQSADIETSEEKQLISEDVDSIYIIVLSAKSEQQLKRMAVALLAYNEPINLLDLAYTLQIGRTAMSHRLALMVTNYQELQEKLHFYVDDKPCLVKTISDIYYVDLLAKTTTNSVQSFISAVINEHKSIKLPECKLLADWLQGKIVNWSNLYHGKKTHRLHLPTYQFAQESYWVISSTNIPSTVVHNNQNHDVVTAMDSHDSKTSEHEDISLFIYQQHWQINELIVNNDVVSANSKIQTLLCIVSVERQAVIRLSLKAQDPNLQLLFYTPQLSESSEKYYRYFNEVQKQKNIVDTVLCFVKPKFGPEFLFSFFKGLLLSSLTVKRVVIASGFKDGLERSYTDAIVAFETSLHLVLPSTQVIVIGFELFSDHLQITKWQSIANFIPKLWAECQANKGHSVIYLKGERYVLSITKTHINTTNSGLKTDANYLITGGSGGLGLLFTKHLCENFQAHVILIGRSPLDAKKQARLDSIEQAGGKITYLQADVCDLSQIQAVLEYCQSQHIKINAVIHAAGMQTTNTLAEKNLSEFQQVLAPKIQGTIIFDEAWQAVFGAAAPLDFVAYFSSSAAVLGDFGSCDYAIGNRFLMSYANYRNALYAQGKCSSKTIAINWPVWQEGGMTQGSEDREQATKLYLQSSGQRALTTSEGLAIFEHLLISDYGSYLIMVGKLSKIERLLGLRQSETVLSMQQTARFEDSRRPEMKGFTVEQCVLWELQWIVGNILSIERRKLHNETNLADFGFDSISLAEFAVQLSNHWNIKVSPSLFFGHVTLRQLCEYFLKEHQQLMQKLYTETLKNNVQQNHSVNKKLNVSSSLRSLESQATKIQEPVAIIGMSGRFPGARDIDEMWQHLVQSRQVITRVNPEYLRRRSVNCSMEDSSSKKAWWCGIMPGVAEFDPLFFEISPREAENMDPRQRQLLQEAWKALENAAYGAEHLKNCKIGTFVGVEEGEYNFLASGVEITANHNGILASRLAYFLDFHGPVLAINTACSSGLVAIHQACLSLRNNECDTAIAAAVSLQLTVEGFEIMKRSGMLSEDGTCYAFDKRANGMVPGEAVVVLVLKLLSKAESDDDPIHGMIRASGINYDGKTNGITAPNGVAQANLIKEVYQRGKIDPEQIEYIVTHGTGTKLGDPVEINALYDVFKDNTNKRGFCVLTSTKTNFGHTFAASGLVSTISLIQAFNEQIIPASLHCQQENNYINWENSPFYVNKTPKEWSVQANKQRLGAVSAFGMSGTNAHMVLQEYHQTTSSSVNNEKRYLLTLSAKTKDALSCKIEDFTLALQQTKISQKGLKAISYTLLEGRHHFQYRLAVVVEDIADAIFSLQQAINMEQRPNLFLGNVPVDFTGQKTIHKHAEDLLEKCLAIEELQEYQETLCALADYYCQGYVLDWSKLYSERPKRIGLPTYPFIRENYWVAETQESSVMTTGTVVESVQLHPLLQNNASTFSELRYCSQFSGEEFFLADHQIHGQKVLPGVTYLEMARAAYCNAAGLNTTFKKLSLKQVLWLQPVVVSTKPTNIYLSLYEREDSQIDYQIYSEVGQAEMIVHGQGVIDTAIVNNGESVSASKLDIKTLQRQMTSLHLDSVLCYQKFDAMGLQYGSTLQGLQELLIGDNQVLARVVLPEMVAKQHSVQKQFVLHPSLIDSAFQASLGFNISANMPTAYVPFALEQLDILREIGTQAWVWLRSASKNYINNSVQKIDIDIYDDQQNLCIRMHGFSSRILQQSDTTPLNLESSKITITKTLTGKEYFLQDHGRLLPGVISLEWAREQATLLLSQAQSPSTTILGLKNVVWSQPIIVEETGADISIDFHRYDQGYAYVVRSQELVHAEGKVVTGLVSHTASKKLSLTDIRSRCQQIKNRDNCANFFGTSIGPRFLAITEFRHGVDEALATLELHNDIIVNDKKDWVLHPALMNGAILASIILALGDAPSFQPLLPFTIDELWIYQSLPAKVFVYICQKETGTTSSSYPVKYYSIQFLDSNGMILVFIKNFALISAQAKSTKEKLIFATPQWNEQICTNSLVNEKHASKQIQPWFILARENAVLKTALQETWPNSQVTCLSNINSENSEQTITHLQNLFAQIQVVMLDSKRKPQQPILLLLAPNNSDATLLAAWAGLIKTACQEQHNLCGKIIRHQSNWSTEAIKKLLAQLRLEIQCLNDEVEIDYDESGIRKVKTWRDSTPETIAGDVSTFPIHTNSVVWITGGLGGIGYQIAKYLGTQHRVKLVLSGRSALHDKKKERLNSLRSQGVQVTYLEGDIANFNQTRNIVKCILKNQGQLNGIIHSAGVIRDSYIVNKNEKELLEVLKPKIAGILTIDAATRDMHLDFIVLCSSLSGVFGNIGQADYAIANGFLDGFATKRNQYVASGHRWGKTISINWPFWRDGGMSIAEQNAALIKQKTGMTPMPTATGLYALKIGLQSKEQQLLVLHGDVKTIYAKLFGPETKHQAQFSLSNKNKPIMKQSFSDQVSSAADSVDVEQVYSVLVNIVSQLQKLDLHKIELDIELSKYGFNSLEFTEFASRLNKIYGLELMPTVFFEYSTVRAIGNHLSETYSAVIEKTHAIDKKESVQADFVSKDISTQQKQLAINTQLRTIGWRREAVQQPSQMQKISNTSSEAIAIIGMSGRFPQAQNLDEFWQHLEANHDLVSEVPTDRWNWKEYYGDPHDFPGKTKVKWGGFMQEVDCFDPLFFGISPREAQSLDPQFRVFLETVWSTIEDAGYCASDLSGSKTGVFVGVSTSEYKDAWLKYSHDKFGIGDPPWLSHFALANRVSYILNLHGPSEPIDTACSSSLVAIHRAIESIRSGSCTTAIVGGVNIIVNPGITITASEAGILSEDGRCRTFSKEADGYGRGEGVGAIMFKPVSQAKADKDRIHGLILGSAENHGGKAASPTAPNPFAQQALLVKAYSTANIHPETVGYIEAHGTGTKLGDPIEINGLRNAFQALYQQYSKTMTKTAYCGLGSVKTNIGHLEAAAGISGVLKILLMFRHKKIPGNVHLKEVNHYLKIANSPFYLVQDTQNWPAMLGANGHPMPRRAGISSFGIGGANAHVIIEEYTQTGAQDSQLSTESSSIPSIIVMSAKKTERLQVVAKRLYDFLKSPEYKAQQPSISEIAYTLQIGREAMNERLGCLVSSVAELRKKLQDYLSQSEHVNNEMYCGSVKSNKQNVLMLADDKEWQEIIEKWIKHGKYSKLLELWVQGIKINWHQLYAAKPPRRIGLPTYPFARERFWLASQNNQIQLSATQQPSPNIIGKKIYLHPLVHQNTSNIQELCFTSRFNGDEFFLDDHQIMGKKIFPGVAYLEMTRAAIEQAVGFGGVHLTFTRIVWIRPFIISKKSQGEVSNTVEENTLKVRLFPQTAQNIQFEIYSFAPTGADHIHCQGIITVHTAAQYDVPMPLDVQLAQGAYQKGQISHTDCYRAFSDLGIEYGATHRSIETLYLGEKSVLARLILPASIRNTQDSYVLHPSLMDGALQATIGLSRANEHKLSVPFELESMEIFASCTNSMWATIIHADNSLDVRKTVQKLNINLYGESGQLCVRLRCFSARNMVDSSSMEEINTVFDVNKTASTLKNIEQADVLKKSNDKNVGTLMFVPKWVTKIVPANNNSQTVKQYASHKVLLCVTGTKITKNLPGLTDCSLLLVQSGADLIDRFNQYALTVFTEVKAILASKPKQDVLLQLVVAGDASQRLSVALIGLLKTAHLENSRFFSQLIEVESSENDASISQKLLENSQVPEDTHVRYDHNGRQVLSWQEQIANVANQIQLPWKEGGVYLITGGVGALGLIFAAEIARQIKKVQLILTGRSVMNDRIQQAIHELNTLGAQVNYQVLDVTDSQKVIHLVADMQGQYGTINGVLHSAGVLRDNYILRKSLQDFQTVLAPKVQGVVNIDQALAQHPLDFFIVFSSTAAIFGNPGQADYVTANAFMDAYAHYRQHLVNSNARLGRSLSINWPLWKEGGMQVDEVFKTIMRQNTGIVPMQTVSGIQAFYQAFACQESQILVIAGEIQNLRKAFQSVEIPKKELQKELQVATSEMKLPIIPESTNYPSRKIFTGSGVPEVIVDVPELQGAIQETLIREVSELLNVDMTDIDADIELHELGFDSILTASFTNKLNRSYGLELMPTVFFEYPTIGGLSSYLVDNYQAVFATKFADHINHHDVNSDIRDQANNSDIQKAESVQSMQIVSAIGRETFWNTVQSDCAQKSQLSLDINNGLYEKIKDVVVQEVSSLLQVGTNNIDLDVTLHELGFDSILVTSFANRLNQQYELNLLSTVFFEHPTITGLTKYLAQTYHDIFSKHFAVTIQLQSPVQNKKSMSSQSAHVQKHDLQTTALSKIGVNTVVAEQTETHSPSDKKDPQQLIAIVGMSGSFPMAPNLDAYWENLVQGKDCISEVPQERWDWKDYLEEVSKVENKDSIKWGGFMQGMQDFDALFFGISPWEAELMDPQQRLLMTHIWNVIEDAGYSAKSLSGSSTGIFVGTGNTGYAGLIVEAKIPAEGFTATGIVPSIGPNRMSYFLNIHGPSEPIETACSSSLIAIHRGVLVLQAESCEMVIVGGINTLVTPDTFISFCKAGMLAQNGRCKTFSKEADGYVRGEGVGMLLLKNLRDAEASGDHIYGLIRTTAENHGGRASSLTAPNPKAQVALLKSVYQSAGIDTKSITYIEAHGTGTELGDPIEINSLKTAFKELQEEYQSSDLEQRNAYCGIGSVKTNIGHLEMAAGIAGVIKVLLQLRHKTLVKSLHAEEINPYIDVSDSPFYIVHENRPWKRLKNTKGETLPLRTGVSSFGFGGSNAHILLEEYQDNRPKITPMDNKIYIILLSAKNEQCLQQAAINLYQYLKKNKDNVDFSLANLAYTLQVGRDAMKDRLGWIILSVDELIVKILDFLKNTDGAVDVYRGKYGNNKSLLAQFSTDKELREAITKWAERGKYAKLLDFWCKGLEFDWTSIHEEEVHLRRVSLPTYPFEQKRYWISKRQNMRRDSSPLKSVLHPLVHENTSNLDTLCYSSQINKNSPFLYGTGNKKQFSSLAELEMIRAAVTMATGHATGITIRNVRWGLPLMVDASGKIIHISLMPCNTVSLSNKKIQQLNCEIYTKEPKETDVHILHNVVYVQGSVELYTHSDSTYLNIQSLHTELNLIAENAEQFRQRLESFGLYDETECANMHHIYHGDQQILAELNFCNTFLESPDELLIHPTLLQKVLMLSYGFIIFSQDITESPNIGIKTLFNTRYPLQLERVEILGAYTPPVIYVLLRCPPVDNNKVMMHQRKQSIILDIDLYNEKQQLFLRITGLQLPVQQKINTEENTIFDLDNYLIQLISEQLKVASNIMMERLDQDLDELGMNSVASVDLLNKLKKKFPNISRSLFMEFRTIREIREYLLSNFQEQLLITARKATPTFDLNSLNLDLFKPLHSFHNHKFYRDQQKLSDSSVNISMIGMAGIFPQADSIAEFWNNVSAGQATLSVLSDKRRRLMALDDQDIGVNKIGGYLEDIEYFDHNFFKVSHKEANKLDPQLRKLIEVVWQAISDAGYTLNRFRQKRTGLFVATRGHSGYQDIRAKTDPNNAVKWRCSAEQTSAYANFISNILNISGPSEIVETGCSSFLVAIRHAITSIKEDCCQQAIVATAELGLSPFFHNHKDDTGLYSAHSVTKSFSIDSDGYVKSEVVGAIVLKSEHIAENDGDSIYINVKGVGVYHGGKAPLKWYSPNIEGQRLAIQAAFTESGIDPGTVSYIEPEANGSQLGDAAELIAIQSMYGPYIQSKTSFSSNELTKIAIGSIKPLIGHAETASTFPVLVKMVLSMYHQKLAKIYGLKELNEGINLMPGFELLKEDRIWPRLNGPRRAAIHSMSLGGVNAHVILEEYHRDKTSETSNIEDNQHRPLLFVFSEKTEAKLKTLVDKYLKFLSNVQSDIAANKLSITKLQYLKQLEYTLHEGRENESVRLAIIAKTLEQLQNALKRWQNHSKNRENIYDISTLQKTAKINQTLVALNPSKFGIQQEETANLEEESLQNLALDWVAGKSVNWSLLHQAGPNSSMQKLNLPTNPLDKVFCWHEGFENM